MPHYTVYYKRKYLQPPYERPLFRFDKIYAETGTVEARDLDELANLLQSPKDEDYRANCARLKVHTLLSPDDIVRDEAGVLWMRQLHTWKRLG
jgi:hypothetical protein